MKMNDSAEAASSTRPPRPVALKVVAENIPEELRRLCNWVTWRYEFRERAKKWTKPPYQLDGKNARTNDSSTWAPYEAVFKRYEEGGFDGIGIVLTTEMGIVGVDLDHCYNPQTNSFESWATKIIEDFNSYSELSHSGTGVRIFLKGKLPAGGHKKENIEIYSTGRYLTVTGHLFKANAS